MAISLVVADDHEVVRNGVATMVKGSDIRIVAEAATADEAVSRSVSNKPDVVLLDVRMGEGDGFAALEKIRKRAPNSRVVMLSTYDNPNYVARSVALGAVDYVLKGSNRSEILAAIRRAAAGDTPSASSVLEKVRSAMTSRPEHGENLPLTPRELQVLKHVALGLSNREIGRSLGISVETVKEHVQNILRKIQAGDRTQAAVWAVKKGLA